MASGRLRTARLAARCSAQRRAVWRSARCGSRRWRRGTSGRTRRRASCRRRAARDRRQNMRDSPSEAASRPAACGAASKRPVSAPRTIAARRLSGSVASPNSSTMTSKVQASPRWLQCTPSTSNGVALKRSATPSTSDGATNRNTARGSTKRRISQGQAMRSTLGRARVTQTVRPCGSSGRHLVGGDQRQAGVAPAFEAVFQAVGRHAGVAQPGGDALAQLGAFLADHDGGMAVELVRPGRGFGVGAAHRAGNRAGDGCRSLRRCERRAGQGNAACRSGARAYRQIWC